MKKIHDRLDIIERALAAIVQSLSDIEDHLARPRKKSLSRLQVAYRRAARRDEKRGRAN